MTKLETVNLAVQVMTLLVTLFGAFAAWMVFWRDKSELQLYGSVFEQEKGRYGLSISASNVGKRPTSLRFVEISRAGHPVMSFQFLPSGAALLDAGGTVSTLVPRQVAEKLWSNVGELYQHAFFVIDSANKKHRVPMGNRSKLWALRNRLFGRPS